MSGDTSTGRSRTSSGKHPAVTTDSNEAVVYLNVRAHRTGGGRVVVLRKVALHDGIRAAVDDTMITRRNDRQRVGFFSTPTTTAPLTQGGPVDRGQGRPRTVRSQIDPRPLVQRRRPRLPRRPFGQSAAVNKNRSSAHTVLHPLALHFNFLQSAWGTVAAWHIRPGRHHATESPDDATGQSASLPRWALGALSRRTRARTPRSRRRRGGRS